MLPKIGGQAKKAEERTALSQAPRVWETVNSERRTLWARRGLGAGRTDKEA